MIWCLFALALWLWWWRVQTVRHEDAMTLHDEYGDTGILQPCPHCGQYPDNRRNVHGKALGAKPVPLQRMTYDEHTIQSRGKEPLIPIDVQGRELGGM